MLAGTFFIGQVERQLPDVIAETDVIGIEFIFRPTALIQPRSDRRSGNLSGKGE
jgi:hypothetical protein